MVGVIYAVGGQTKSGNSLSTVEVYDPTSGRWKDAEAMSMLRSRDAKTFVLLRLSSSSADPQPFHADPDPGS